MRIANPIYDVVFKYLLDDEKVGKIMLSALLGREVLDLKARATEVRHEVRKEVGPPILILRMDFAATVRMEDGSRKLVLIEIQKAHHPTDVLRFRKYLGSQYSDDNNTFLDGTGRLQALPLVTIYFLGEGLEHTDAPVVRVNRQYVDAATGEEILDPEPFVEALTHESIIIQIDRLKDRRRTELERLLMVFDQGRVEPGTHHHLDIGEEEYPERYREVFRRLYRAIAEKQVRDGMDVEDEYLVHVRSLAEKDQALEERDKALEEKDKALEEKDKVIAEYGREVAETRKSLEEKDRLIGELLGRLERTKP